MELRKIFFLIIVAGAILAICLAAVLKPVLWYRLGPPDIPATATGMALRATNVALAATEVAIAATKAAIKTQDGTGDPNSKTPGPEVAPAEASNLTWEGLRLEVVAIDYDAWSLIKAQNQFNAPPQVSKSMLMITVKATKEQKSLAKPVRLTTSDFSLIGENRVVYNTYDKGVSCGVVPDNLDGVVSQENSIEGNICFQTPKDERNFTLIYDKAGDDYPAVYIKLPVSVQ